MVIVSHPTGNTFTRALLAGLHARGLLAIFATTFGASRWPVWTRCLPRNLRKEMGRRTYELPVEKIFSRPALETARLLAGRLGWHALTRHETGWASVDAVYQDLDRAVARRLPGWSKALGVSAVYGFEDGALHTLRVARQLGITPVYELPIAYWETALRLLREEAERWPEWEPTLVGTRDSDQKLERKTEELRQAEIVVCPSRFVLDSLPDWARNTRRCVVAEFGSPAVYECHRPTKTASGRLRVLFAGSMSQRKGLADVFSAMRRLARRDVELVVMGSPIAPMEFYRRQLPDFTYHPPRPHHEVLKLMQTCDVLILPSIVEGRALVQQEALSCGLPLIVTPNAGGEDLVDDGKTGFLVPIRDPERLAERIVWCCEHRSELEAMREAAREKAAKYTWQRYQEAIIGHLENNLSTVTVA